MNSLSKKVSNAVLGVSQPGDKGGFEGVGDGGDVLYRLNEWRDELAVLDRLHAGRRIGRDRRGQHFLDFLGDDTGRGHAVFLPVERHAAQLFDDPESVGERLDIRFEAFVRGGVKRGGVDIA